MLSSTAMRLRVVVPVFNDWESLDVLLRNLESLAENFSDGVVAPAFWTAVFGLPGGALYKAANTADSMIGHKNQRYFSFGWAAARFDDVINLPASRLAALWLILAAYFSPGADPAAGWRAVWRDAGKHRSPNAGWPEAAMARAWSSSTTRSASGGMWSSRSIIVGTGPRRSSV